MCVCVLVCGRDICWCRVAMQPEPTGGAAVTEPLQGLLAKLLVKFLQLELLCKSDDSRNSSGISREDVMRIVMSSLVDTSKLVAFAVVVVVVHYLCHRPHYCTAPPCK